MRAVVCCLLALAPLAAQVDVTDHLVRVGSPFAALYPDGPKIYARNLWDLRAHGTKLYLGAGNSSNYGPAVNSGPVPIIEYDPATGQFAAPFKVDDEQVDVFYVDPEGRLVTPGHDPKESWALGNFYRLEADGWRKIRTIPGGIHTYCLAWHHGKLLAGLGTQQGAQVASSEDQGQTWTSLKVPQSRVYSFLQCEEQLWATGMFGTVPALAEGATEEQRRRHEALVAAWSGGAVRYADDGALDQANARGADWVLPGLDLPSGKFGKVVQPQQFGTAAVYLGAYVHNDHQFLPVAVYAAGDLQREPAREVLKLAGHRPWDILVHGGFAYVLLEEKLPQGCRMKVMRSADLDGWQEVLRFTAPTFARSFALMDSGDWYFGLGCEVADPRQWNQDELHPATGDLLRVERQYWQVTR